MRKKTDKMMQIAKAASPVILERLGKEQALTQSAVDRLNESLTSALETYGLDNPQTIQAVVQGTAPVFGQIADRYFFLLQETLNVSASLGRRYDPYTAQTVEAILADDSSDMETKAALVDQFIAARRKEDRKDVHTPLKIAAGTGAALGLGALAAWIHSSDNRREIAVEAIRAGRDTAMSEQAFGALKFIITGLIRWYLP